MFLFQHKYDRITDADNDADWFDAIALSMI